MSEIVVKTENVIAVVAQAKRALESGNVSAGYRLFGDAKKGGIAIIKETKYLLERVTAVEKHYKEIEDAKSREIGELYRKEEAIQKEREAKTASMRSKELELQLAQRKLTYINENLSRARRRKEEAESKKEKNLSRAVGFGIATVLTLGLASPITLPAAAICAVKAVDASFDEDEAERDIYKARKKISECKGEIAQYEKNIRQLDDEIATLSWKIRHLKSERDNIHAQRGELTDMIKYLRDVLYFWNEFGQLTEHGTDRATVLQKLSLRIGLRNKYATRLSHQVESCISAWERVEKKLENANQHIFSIDFTCQFCHNTFQSLPHLRYETFCCIRCYIH